MIFYLNNRDGVTFSTCYLNNNYRMAINTNKKTNIYYNQNISHMYDGISFLWSQPYNFLNDPISYDKVIDMSYAFCNSNVEYPICGPNVINMCNAFRSSSSGAARFKGNYVCGNNVVDMSYAYYYLGSDTSNVPVCGPNVVNMAGTYYNCYKLTTAVCGNKVIDMNYTYYNCSNLTVAVCGPNVVNMTGTYHNCYNLTTAACGPNVKYMTETYSGCNNLVGVAACGPNVIYMERTYHNAIKLTKENIGNNVRYLYHVYNGTNNVNNINVWLNSVVYAINAFYVWNITGNIYIPVIDEIENNWLPYLSNLIGSGVNRINVFVPLNSPLDVAMRDNYSNINKFISHYAINTITNITNGYQAGPNVYIYNNLATKIYRNIYNETDQSYYYMSSQENLTVRITNNMNNIKQTYAFCNNLTGTPVCGDGVVNFYQTYYNCHNLTGSPACGNNVTYMVRTYYGCSNLSGTAACGPNVIEMDSAYFNCPNLTIPACGNNVVNMPNAYRYCNNLREAACGPNVVNMENSFAYCNNLVNAVCGPNVINMQNSYDHCCSLINAVCGNNVINMSMTYDSCYNLTTAACGPNVNSLYYTYRNCYNLTTAICGNNVRNMFATYQNCNNLIGNPVCGDNVRDIGYAYQRCDNISGNIYFNNVTTIGFTACFGNKNLTLRNLSKRINVYVKNRNTFDSIYNRKKNSTCILGYNGSYTVSWTNINTNAFYGYNLYVYYTP